MKEENPPKENPNLDLDNSTVKNPNLDLDNTTVKNPNEDLDNASTTGEYSKWVDNQGDEVKNVFGFNSSAELVNGRAAMIGFLMLLLTELVFKGKPVTSSIFGIN